MSEVDRSMIYEREYMYRTHGQSGKQNTQLVDAATASICMHGPNGGTPTAHKYACQHVPDAESVRILRAHTHSIY
jgi:hypothetical protein